MKTPKRPVPKTPPPPATPSREAQTLGQAFALLQRVEDVTTADELAQLKRDIATFFLGDAV